MDSMFSFKCNLYGEGTSLVGDQNIQFDAKSKTINITDTGGIFGEPLNKHYSIDNCSMFFFSDKLSKGGIFFVNTPDEITSVGSFESNTPQLNQFFDEVISKNLPLKECDKDTISNLAYEIVCFDRKGNQIENDTSDPKIYYYIRLCNGHLKFIPINYKGHEIKPLIQTENQSLLHFSKIKHIEEDLSGGLPLLIIAATFNFNNQLVSTIGFTSKFEKKFVDKIIDDCKRHTSSIEDGCNVSNVFKVTGYWKNVNFEKTICDVLFKKNGDITIRPIEQTIEDTNLPFDNIVNIEWVDNYIITSGHQNDLIMIQTDFEFIDVLFNENLFWLQHLHLSQFRNPNTNIIACIINQNNILSPLLVYFNDDKIILRNYKENFTYNIKDINRFSAKGSTNLSIIEISINNSIHQIECNPIGSLKFENYLIKNKILNKGLFRSYEFRHEKELTYLLEARKNFVANDSIQQLYQKVQEPTTIPDFIGKAVVINENQFKHVWHIINEGSTLLDIRLPEAYVYDSFFYKIDSEGIQIPRLEITSKMIEDFTDNELRFAIGSSLAHIALEHLPPEVTMEGVINLIPQLNQIPGIGGILQTFKALDVATMLLKMNYYRWSRTAILSADRFGYIFSGSLKSSCNAIMKVILNSSTLSKQANISNYLFQTERLNTLRGIAAFYTKSDESIPYGTERILNLFRYANSPLGQLALSKMKNLKNIGI